MKVKYPKNIRNKTTSISYYNTTHKIEFAAFKEYIIVNTKYGKLKFKSVYTSFNSDLEAGRLATQHKIKTPIGEHKVKNDLYFYDDESIKSCQFTKPQIISTPIGKLTLSSNSDMEFYNNGNFKAGQLEYPQIIDTPIGKLKIYRIYLYKSGKIEICYITGLQKIKTQIGELKIEQNVGFYENGIIKETKLSEPQKIKTPIGKLKLDSHIMFYDNGNIEYCILSKDKTIKIKTRKNKTKKLKIHESITFYKTSKNKLKAYEEVTT